MHRGLNGRRTLALSVAVGLIGLVGPSSAGAAIQIGETFSTDNGSCNAGTRIQTTFTAPSYAAPSAGVITSWSFRADASPPTLKLKVARSAGGNDYAIVGESSLEIPNPNQVNTFPTRVPVEAGDLIGSFDSTSGHCAVTGTGGYQISTGPGGTDVPLGTTATFNPGGSGIKLDLSASLEPDCDGDGFGDETQDVDLSGCPQSLPQGAPETTITKGPKHKTKKKKATFEFSSSLPGASFECELDHNIGFAPCSSPLEVKVGGGKHNFQVRAKDGFGNADLTPASDDWNVKKKK